MSSDPTALSALAARTVVAAASTDAWGTAKREVARLLGRGDPKRRVLVELRLGQTHDQLKATGWREREQVRVEEAIWRTQLADLLKEDPDKTGELQALVDQIQEKLPAGMTRAAQKADKREQWRDALQPLPRIFDWYKANAVAGTVLGVAFLVVKGYVIARGDLATALGILQYAGLGTVVTAGLLSSLPILTAAMLAYTVSQVTLSLIARDSGASRIQEPKPPTFTRPLAWVTLGAFVLAAVFTPWTYLALAALFGLVIGLMQTERVPELAARAAYTVVVSISVAAVILSLYTVWVPHEIVTFRPGTLAYGRTNAVGYVLSEGNGWIAMLSTGLGEEHRLIHVPDAAVKKQIVCERRPTPGHLSSHFLDAVTLWRLVTGDYSSLAASANVTCPYQGL
jgi:hypothetical protein